MNKNNSCWWLVGALLLTTACEENNVDPIGPDIDPTDDYVINEEEYYTGGKLGTVFNASSYAFQQLTPATEKAGMSQAFKLGEYFFERDFVETEGTAFQGLGPVMVRNGCLYCHPNYGYGHRTEQYKASEVGNGYLLVIYDKSTDAYLRSVAGMPQTLATHPFKAPIDENQISIKWLNYTDEWGNKFSDGETYSLIYPEVTIPESAYYAPLIAARNGKNVEIGVEDVGVRLESTIGVYGTGITDAIPDDSITAEWVKQSKAGYSLNPAYWNSNTHEWASYYSGLTGKKYVRRYTYAMSRGPILDAAGANAIWNITNVTRSDRRYHYLDLNYNAKAQTHSYYAEKASKDPEVQQDFYHYYPEYNKTENVETDIYNYLTATDLTPEMSDVDYKNFMIWHRGLAVPAARNLGDAEVRKGHKLFREIGCASCHRPSWTTGDDNIQDPNGIFTNNDMPRYPHQKIWPYTDFVQHRLFMKNDIRTGWCRTTPLWGRGLSKLVTGAEDRLHDRRARNTLEAIMWHGCSSEGQISDAHWSVEKFRQLNKEERDAVIRFIDSI